MTIGAAVFSAYILINMTVIGCGSADAAVLRPPEPEPVCAGIRTGITGGCTGRAVQDRKNHAPLKQTKLDFRYLYKNSTVGMLGSLVCGLANGSFWALAPVFSVAYSSEISVTANFMTAVVFGGAVGQWPLGWLSDRIDRRLVLGGISLMGVIIGAIMWLMAPGLSSTGIIALAALWGAMSFPVYSISVAHANDRADPGKFVMVSAGLLLMYGVGAIIGPFIASMMMAYGTPGYLFLFTGIVHLLLATYVITRRMLRKQPPQADHKPFSDALASTQTSSQIYEEELNK